MVTECTPWYPNARWSSRLKERLLAVLESRAPHWADINIFVFFFSFFKHPPTITNIPFLKNGLWLSQWLFIPSDFKELSSVSITGILSHLNRLRGKEHESRHKGWWQSVTHTCNITGASLLLLMDQNYLQRGFTRDKSTKFHLHLVGSSNCRFYKLMTSSTRPFFLNASYPDGIRLASGTHWYDSVCAVICFSRPLLSSEMHINRKDTQNTHMHAHPTVCATLRAAFRCQEPLWV